MSMFKAVIFDYGKVLGNNADDWNGCFKAIPEATGLSAEELSEVWNKYWRELETGKISLDDVWKKIILRSRTKVDKNYLTKIYRENVVLEPELFSLVQELKQKNYLLTILANESKEGMEFKIKKFELNKYFTKIYCSADLGIAKPARKIYEYVLQDLKLLPEEVIFIDNLERNILPARELGIKSILFKDVQRLKEELKLIFAQ